MSQPNPIKQTSVFGRAIGDYRDMTPAPAVDGTGILILRGPFPFTFDSPGIDGDGLPLYTPAEGQILHDALIEVDTAWNGTSPVASIVIVGATGPLGPAAPPIDLTTVSPPTMPRRLTSTAPIGVQVSITGVQAHFTDVTQTTLADPTQASIPAAATTPWTVVASVSDRFQWAGGNGYDPPELFTVAPGVYATTATAAVALAAAIGAKGEAFSTRCSAADAGGGNLLLTAVDDIGARGMNDSLYSAPTRDAFAILFGFTAATPADGFVLGEGNPVIVLAGISDQFIWAGDGGAGPPETFTMAPGSYGTTAALAAAIEAAIGSLRGEPFSNAASVADVGGGSLMFTCVADLGTAGNGDTFYSAPARDVVPQIFNIPLAPGDNHTTGGTGSAPTQGAGRVYLITT